MQNGTLSMRAMVRASRVLPVPVSPTITMLLFSMSTSSDSVCGTLEQSLVVVVNGHREVLLGLVLADDVLIQELLDILGF